MSQFLNPKSPSQEDFNALNTIMSNVGNWRPVLATQTVSTRGTWVSVEMTEAIDDNAIYIVAVLWGSRMTSYNFPIRGSDIKLLSAQSPAFLVPDINHDNTKSVYFAYHTGNKVQYYFGSAVYAGEDVKIYMARLIK